MPIDPMAIIKPVAFTSDSYSIPSKEAFEAAIAASLSNKEAAERLGVDRVTFRKHARKYGVYIPWKNKGGKGIVRPNRLKGPPLEDVLSNHHPDVSLYALKDRLVDAKYLVDQCAYCGCAEQRISDGKRPLRLVKKSYAKGIVLENLHILCYNCCFLTSGYIRDTNTVGGALSLPPGDAPPVIPDDPFLNGDDLDAFMNDLRTRVGNVHKE